jgi:dephospho-CoA kinase
MLRVGLTGGIGAGKTTVARIFGALGVPLFFADDSARALMDNDPVLRAQITALLGVGAYTSSGLDRAAVSKAVFGNSALRESLNALVHPVTAAAGDAWFEAQTTPYAIKEAAIFFETGGDKAMDVMIGVSAPEPLRISRTMKRSGLFREGVLSRIASQMPQEEKMGRCTFVIQNDDITALLPQVLSVNEALLKMAI